MKLLLFVAFIAAAHASTFFSYTRLNLDTPQEVTILNVDNSFMNPSAKTYFLTHGFGDNATVDWMIRSKDEFLLAEDCNVVLFDWLGTSGRVVEGGQDMARFYDTLIGKNYSSSSFYCTGHDLGGHVCGFSGKLITAGRLGRITGLDVASGNEFVYGDPTTRLASTDADMVDVIHTAGGDRNFREPLGKADFYPNGGEPTQPGCLIEPLNTCSHYRATVYFIEGIVSRGFLSRSCDTWDNYSNGICNANPEISMGPTHMPLTASGNYYLTTNRNFPFAEGAP